MIDFNVSMDIETMGLNPWMDRVVTAAFIGNQGDTFEVFDDPEDEDLLLGKVEAYMRKTRIEQLVSWNGTEFDLPFLAVRMVLNGIDMPPLLKPTGQVGKYGHPRYDGYWYGAKFRDIAYDYQQEAAAAQVAWSLKPFAAYKKLGPGITVDFSTTSILDLTKDERALYCTSDAQLVMGLFLQQDDRSMVQGKAVLLDGGGLSIL